MVEIKKGYGCAYKYGHELDMYMYLKKDFVVDADTGIIER